MAHQANANMVRKWVVKFQRGGFGEATDTGMKLLPVAVRKPAAISVPMKVAAPTRDAGDRNATGRGAVLRPARSGTAEAVRWRADRSMIGLPLGTRVWIAAGVTDMRRGMDSLAALVQTALGEQPFSGDVFVFRGRRGDLVKLLWWSGDGMNLYAKRLERGRFVWPQATSGVVHLSAAQLSMLLEGIDWRRPTRTWQPSVAA